MAAEINQNVLSLIASRKILTKFCGNLDNSICLDGFPRSANTFTTYFAGYMLHLASFLNDDIDEILDAALSCPDGYDLDLHNIVVTHIIQQRILHHQHDPAFFKTIVESGVKAITLLRPPVQALKSLARYYSDNEKVFIETSKKYIKWIELCN